MTVLVAQNLKDKIILTADTEFHIENINFKLTNVAPKIRKIRDGMHFSFAGNLFEADLFEMFCLEKKDKDLQQNRTLLRIAVSNFFNDFRQFIAKKIGQALADCKIENDYFFVCEDRLFLYMGGLQEIQENNYATAGAGYAEANMCMFLGQTPREAIENTIKVNQWTGGEVEEVIIYKNLI